MDAREVVVQEVDRHGGRVILAILAEAIGQPCEPAHAHPHREVLALHIRRGNVLRVVWQFRLAPRYWEA